jgi:hypothetical protein
MGLKMAHRVYTAHGLKELNLYVCEWEMVIFSLPTRPSISNSNIPWYPKLLFQRENAFASFSVVTQPKPSSKRNFLLVEWVDFKFDHRHFFSHTKSISMPYRELSA